jgi:hypothetical protein
MAFPLHHGGTNAYLALSARILCRAGLSGKPAAKTVVKTLLPADSLELFGPLAGSS